MNVRFPRGLASLVLLLPLVACATGRVARNFVPASGAQASQCLEAWRLVQERAATLAASRLLYDARLGSGGLATLPGTLAVVYNGDRVTRASLTGPFGARVAEYDGGSVTGEDRLALVVDPEALRSVLAGTWPGAPGAVAGRDGTDCLLRFDGAVSVEAVADEAEARVRSLTITTGQGRLVIDYSGPAAPWPERLAAREQRSGRSLRLKLVAVEAVAPAEVARP